MSTVARLLAQTQQITELLGREPGSNEREDFEQRLAKVETALTGLESDDQMDRNERTPSPVVSEHSSSF